MCFAVFALVLGDMRDPPGLSWDPPRVVGHMPSSPIQYLCTYSDGQPSGQATPISASRLL